MHEITIAQNLCQILEEKAKEFQAKKILKVRLKVGKLTAVVPEALEFSFQICSQGTSLEGAKLEIEVIPLEARCNTCSSTFPVENYRFSCPKCKGGNIEVISGQELFIENMEVE